MCKENITCIIPMAGRGTRARRYFGDIPKYMMQTNNVFFFEYTLRTLANIENTNFIFICQKSEVDEKFIEFNCQKYGIRNFKIILLDYYTDGQATSIFKAVEPLFHGDEEILIYNVDTYIPNLTIPTNLRKYDGWVSTFHSEFGDRWSFVKFDENKILTDIEEKIKISNFACTGLYYFNRYRLFKDIYIKHKEDIIKKYGESYISPIYQYMIMSEKSVIVTQEDDVLFLDIPDI